MTDEADRILIHELINLHGHLIDEGHFDGLGELFIDAVVYDVTALGGGRLVGPAAIVEAARALGSRNPLGHHVTNIVVTEISDNHATAVSKGLGIVSGGGAGSVVYHDELQRTPNGWRIASRTVLPRQEPLRPSGNIQTIAT